MTEAKIAFGTTLMKGAVPIAELTNIPGPSLSAATIDATSHDSLANAGGYREFLQGVRDGGEISIEGNFIPGNPGQVALRTDFDDGSLDDYTITFPAVMATTWTCKAIVTAFETSSPFDDKASFTASLKVSGKPSLNVTASTGLTTPFFAISESAVVTPDEAGDVYLYVATVATGITSVTVTPTATDGVIKVNGNIVATGEASSAITLGEAGTNTEVTITVKETNKTIKTYTVWVARAAGA